MPCPGVVFPGDYPPAGQQGGQGDTHKGSHKSSLRPRGSFTLWLIRSELCEA